MLKFIFQISKGKKVKPSLQDTAFSSVYNASMKNKKKLSYIDTSKFLYAVMSTNINKDKILMQITHPKITYAVFPIIYNTVVTMTLQTEKQSKKSKPQLLFHVIRLIQKSEG